jgi:hypothetical protein
MINNNDELHPTRSDDKLAQRRLELEARIRAMGGVVGVGPGGGGSPEMVVEFLERVLAFETGSPITHRAWLEQRGLHFPPPAKLRDSEVNAELWRLLRALATARVFIEHTDHLSDAELYRALWTEVLGAEEPGLPRTEADAWHWDLADPSSGEEEAWLTYFADDDEREEWQESFPETLIPERRTPPFSRDHLLPKRD